MVYMNRTHCFHDIHHPFKKTFKSVSTFQIPTLTMATSIMVHLKAIGCLFFFTLAITAASAARSLTEVDTTLSGSVQALTLSGSVPAPTLSGSVQAPTLSGSVQAPTLSGSVQTPTLSGSVQTPTLSGSVQTPVSPAAPVATGTGVAGPTANTDSGTLTFFMHDILGGSNPTARAVTGIVTNPALSAQVPFAKPNGANLPINSGVPQNSGNNGLINNNNVPFLTGLSGNTGNLVGNNNGNNNFIGGGSGFPVLNGGQLPQGMTLQKLMFGTLIVFDDELTEGHELGSGLVGKAQGFYVSSSEDGASQTMALTAMFESGGYLDSISFFGVHRTVVSESQLAIMGGTGKYVDARGFATIKTFPVLGQQQETDGLETAVQFTVYLA